MSGGKAVILVCFKDVPQEIEADWNHWYETRHIPVRLALPGFIAARRFKAYDGECKYVSLYELENLGAITSEPYLALKREEMALPATSLEARTRGLPLVHGVYQQVYPDAEYQMPDADYLFVVAHDIPAHKEDEFTAWYNTEHIPAMLRVPGFVTARRLKLAQPPNTPGGQSSCPQYLALYDLADKGAVENEQFMRDRESPWSTWVRSWCKRRLRIKAQQVTRLGASLRDRAKS
ncbi:MAG: hypothetical protein HY525_18790 [Betaproteobacteria bacterium]|nr:hypothetical protein [Betaproteobacteria bacterium]